MVGYGTCVVMLLSLVVLGPVHEYKIRVTKHAGTGKALAFYVPQHERHAGNATTTSPL